MYGIFAVGRSPSSTGASAQEAVSFAAELPQQPPPFVEISGFTSSTFKFLRLNCKALLKMSSMLLLFPMSSTSSSLLCSKHPSHEQSSLQQQVPGIEQDGTDIMAYPEPSSFKSAFSATNVNFRAFSGCVLKYRFRIFEWLTDLLAFFSQPQFLFLVTLLAFPRQHMVAFTKEFSLIIGPLFAVVSSCPE